jgi:CRP/FNR family transcriptional regulator, dissimilatory nitrate respiration regulator
MTQSGHLIAPRYNGLGPPQDGSMTVKEWLPPDVRLAAIDYKIKAGASLFRLGDKSSGLYEVIAGRIRLARIDHSGRETVLHVARPGEMLAEASLFSPQYHCDAIANTDAIVRIYPKRKVLAAFEKNPKAIQALAETLARQVMSLRTRIELRNIRSASERVRQFLMLNVGPDRRTVVPRGTLKDLAAEIGLTHEVVYRMLAALERSGGIKRKGKKIILSHRV